MDLIQRLALSVLRYPDREFLVDGPLRLTFAEWDRAVNRAARAFRELGVGRQDHVVLALRNREELVTSWYGLMKLGAIATPINYRFSPGEIAYCVKDAEAKVFVFEDVSRESGMRAVGDFPKGCRKIFCDADPPGGCETFSALVEGQTDAAPGESISEDLVCLMLYTSGTTGRPKGVPRAHQAQDASALAQAIQCGYRLGERTLGVMPLYHVMGIVSLMTMVLLNGAFIVMRGFDAEAAVELVAREKISSLYLIPTLFHELLRTRNLKDHDLSCVRRLAFAGAPMTRTLVENVIGRFRPEVFTNHYGSTEIYTFSINQNLREKPSSGGRPGMNSSLRIVKADPERRVTPDEVVPRGEVGEIIASLRSEEGFHGYWRRADADEKAMRHGWYFTGDVGYEDEDGDIHVSGRVDDMIISGGENIYPTEVEDVLTRHPQIVESAVIGVDDPKWGQAVTAFVVPAGKDLTAEEIDRHCREQADFSAFKRPRRVIFVKRIPRTASGKILRRMLRAGEYEPYSS
ncbi:MAG: class I adenylate-forming enzyme family protein [Nitrospinota bacterium]